MNLHLIQQKLLVLAREQNLAGLTLRKIGELIGEPNSPQKIKHHLEKLIEKGLLLVGADGKTLKPASGGIDEKSKLISLPIIGSANCGEAAVCAEQKVEGYLKISLKILGDDLKTKLADLFVLRAVGNSMNHANVKGKNIEEGDFVIVEKKQDIPDNGDYVVSTIDGLANIKKFIFDKQNKQIALVSESSLDLPPIYIHEDDYSAYLVCGKVVDVIKKPDELAALRNLAAKDVLREIGPISKEDYDYYEKI
ncbi:MAG: S24 family peptidase [Patescibacteria group bacterium]|nr:S24 family peptidase [Patescibacteria group bacterium]